MWFNLFRHTHTYIYCHSDMHTPTTYYIKMIMFLVPLWHYVDRHNNQLLLLARNNFYAPFVGLFYYSKLLPWIQYWTLPDFSPNTEGLVLPTLDSLSTQSCDHFLVRAVLFNWDHSAWLIVFYHDFKCFDSFSLVILCHTACNLMQTPSCLYFVQVIATNKRGVTCCANNFPLLFGSVYKLYCL